MEPIQVVGIDKLSENQVETANKLANEYYEKITRSLKNITSLIIHIKVYNKGGGKSKFAVHSRVASPGHHFESSRAIDWNFARTLHKSLKDIERQIEHTFHAGQNMKKNRIMKE